MQRRSKVSQRAFDEKVARDDRLSYPVGNKVKGIDPCENTVLTVTEKLQNRRSHYNPFT